RTSDAPQEHGRCRQILGRECRRKSLATLKGSISETTGGTRDRAECGDQRGPVAMVSPEVTARRLRWKDRAMIPEPTTAATRNPDAQEFCNSATRKTDLH